MAKDTTKDVALAEGKKINKKSEINEAYFMGLMWGEPFDNYAMYGEALSMDEFVHDVWAFYYELGRRMYKDGVKTFDPITVQAKVKEYNVVEDFNEYGGLDTIEDAVSIVEENKENVEYYYETIKRTYTLKQLVLVFGEKVLIETKKYKWKELTKEQLLMYWQDKVNQIGMNNINNNQSENLYIEPEDYFKLLEEDSAELLPYYRSKSMNKATQGIPRGTVTMFGGFGNTGKSSIMAEKFVMSCIENQEKLIIVLNEEDAQSFREKIILSIMYHEHKTGIDRSRIVSNKLQPEDKKKITKALLRMKELMDEDTGLIKVIYMERYVISDLEKIIRFHANRGYNNVLIDTHKVSDDSTHEARWQTFVEDMKTIYRITRKNAGGCNLRTVVTFQLADSAIRNRYLTFDAIGEGKASKNEAATVMMFRPAFSDEYEGGKKALKCYRMVKDEKTGEFKKDFFGLQAGKTYYLMFYPKNRTGANTDNGQPVLVIEPQFNFNHFKEIGYCHVAKEAS